MKRSQYFFGFFLFLLFLLHFSKISAFATTERPTDMSTWQRWGYTRYSTPPGAFWGVYADHEGAPIYSNPNITERLQENARFMEEFEVIEFQKSGIAEDDWFKLEWNPQKKIVWMQAKDLLLYHLPQTTANNNMPLRGLLGLGILAGTQAMESVDVRWYNRPEELNNDKDSRRCGRLPYVYIFKKKAMEGIDWYLVGKDDYIRKDISVPNQIEYFGWISQNNILEWQTAEGFEPNPRRFETGNIPFYLFENEHELKIWVDDGMPDIRKVKDVDKEKYGNIMFEYYDKSPWSTSKIFCMPLLAPYGFRKAPPFDRAYVGLRYWYQSSQNTSVPNLPPDLIDQAISRIARAYQTIRILFVVDSSLSMKKLKLGVAEVLRNLPHEMNSVSNSTDLDIKVNAAVYRSVEDIPEYTHFESYGKQAEFFDLDASNKVADWLELQVAKSREGTAYTESLFMAIDESIKLFGNWNLPVQKIQVLPNREWLETQIQQSDRWRVNILVIIGDAGDHSLNISKQIVEKIKGKNIFLQVIQLNHECLWSATCEQDYYAQAKFTEQMENLVQHLANFDENDPTGRFLELGDQTTNLLDDSTQELISTNLMNHLKDISYSLDENITLLEKSIRGGLSKDELFGLPEGFRIFLERILGEKQWQEILRIKSIPFVRGWIPISVNNSQSSRKVLFMTNTDYYESIILYRKFLKYKDQSKCEEAFYEILGDHLDRDLSFKEVLEYKNSLILDEGDILKEDINDICQKRDKFKKFLDYMGRVQNILDSTGFSDVAVEGETAWKWVYIQ